jgi:hypothetical protein
MLAAAVLGNEAVSRAIAAGLRRAAETKTGFDRAMSAILGVLNLPSRADYNRLLSKVEVLQGSLVNLNIKVDRLLARERPASSSSPGGEK